MKLTQTLGSLVLGSLVAVPVGFGTLPDRSQGWSLAAAQAVQLRDGSTHFVDLPRLIETRSSQTDISTYNARHSLTLTLPEGATEPLGAVVVQQREGSDRNWRYDLDRLRVFSEIDLDRSQPWPMTPHFDRKTHTLTLNFDPPIPPGTTFTLTLTPQRNPDSEGVYLWGITAFPAGDQPVGQFLGYGRFHFYRPDRRWGW